MIPRLPRALCWLVAAFLPALGAPEASAYSGFGRRPVETIYVPSSSSILLEPTAYYVPTSYYRYVPTVYATTSYLPTSYYVTSTAYIRPTTYYAPTRYVVRRPVVTATSSIVERVYYLPTTTTLDLPVVRTSSSIVCCDDLYGSSSESTIITDEPAYALPPEASVEESEVPPPGSSSSSSGASREAEPNEYGEPGLDPGVRRSTPLQPSGTRQTESPPARVTPAEPQTSTPSTGGSSSLVDPEPPSQPAPEQDLEFNLPPPAPATELEPPATVPDDGQQRTALRPTFTRPLAEARSLLLGRVVSAVNGDPEEGVLVTLTDRTGRFLPRTQTTEADGTFSIHLPEGDWAVSVPDTDGAEGQTQIDRYITVSGGVITDDKNREVTMMTINR